jgi:DNA-binding CsgD family transcriptional regulator
LVDGAGMIRRTNRDAERWLQADDVIGAKFGRLVTRNADDQARLTHLIKTATQPIAIAEGGSLSISAGEAGPHARIVVLPVGRNEQSHLDDWETKAVVVIANQEQQRAIAPELLKNTYGLTASEIKVVLGFANGQTLENLSENLGVTLNTVKAHTQHIFQKTGLHRQADLVRLVYGLPALT